MKRRSEKTTAETPQRLVRRVDVCDRCGGADTFRVVGRVRNVQYLKCAACGRRATRLVLAPSGAGAEKGQTNKRKLER